MNKYSKRALKTTATVGMSLAMVLSAVSAPVMAATTRPVCDTYTEYKSGDALLALKTIDGTITVDARKNDLVTKINAMDVSKKVIVDGYGIDSFLGYNIAGTVTAVEDTPITANVIAKDVEYGYFAMADGNYRGDTGTITIKEDQSMEVVKITAADIAERTAAMVSNEVNAYLESVTGKVSSFDGNAVTYDKTITNDKNDKVLTTVELEYSLDAGTTYGNSALAPTTGTITIKASSKGGFKDFVCTTESVAQGIEILNNNHANNVYNEIVKAFDVKKISLDTVKIGEKVDFTGINTSSLGKELKILTGSESTTTIDMDFKATLENLSKYIPDTNDAGKAIVRFLGIEDAMVKMFEANGYLVKAEAYGDKYEFKTTEAYATAVELLEKFTEFETYLTNLSTESYDRVTEARDNLQDLVDGYVAENDGDLLDTYLTALDKFYENFVETKGEAGITKADVDRAIKDIKTNGFTVTVGTKSYSGTKADYSTFKENAGVEDYMTKFEDMYEEITAVKDAVSKTNDTYKALIKGNTSVKDFLNGKDSDRELKPNKEFSAIKSGITIEEYNILKAYKEEVLDVVLTMETKEVGNSYVNKSTKSMFATKAQLNAVLANIGNKATEADLNKGVLTALDKETGEFNWDKLATHMDKVVSSYEALTKGIEKLDSITLVAGDRAAILAADEAVYFLTGSGADNLTSAETRAVKNAERKVDELMEAYRLKFGSLNVELNSWVNKGNGDWAYYENGNAVTKWVAAGTNWFYVKDGVMLRNSWVANNSTGSVWYYVNNEGQMVSNTTVNGYVFDANGVWVK